MRKLLSLSLSASLVLSTVTPALAVDSAVKGHGQAPVVLPIVNIPTTLNAVPAAGLDGLTNLPNINSIDAQAIDAAVGLAPAAVGAAGVRQTDPSSPRVDGRIQPISPALTTAIEATAEEVQAEGPTASAQLDRVESAAVTGDRQIQERVWEGLRDSVSGVPAMTKGPVSRFSTLRRAATTLAPAAALVLGTGVAQAAVEKAGQAAPAAPAAMPHWLSHLVTQYQPYLTVAASALGLWAINKGANWVVGKIADKRGTDADGKKTAQLVTSLIVWGLGTLATLHYGGAPQWVMDGVASLIPAGVTITSKHIIGNALEASKVLFYHSFVIGDRIKIGDVIYKVEDLSLTEVTLKNEAFPKGSPTTMTYLQLAGRIITVLRPGETEHKLTLERPKVTPVEAGSMVLKTLGSANRKTWLWIGGGIAAAVLSTLAVPLVMTSVPFLVTVLGLVKGAAIFSAVHNVRTLALDFISRFGEKAQWHPQTTRVAKFIAEVISYSVGGTWALGAAGTSLSALMKGSLATGMAFTLVSQEFLSNLVQAFRLKRQNVKGKKTFKIGEWILVNGVLGKVFDMDFQYVKLAHDDDTHSLVSYAILKDSEFTSFTNDADLVIAKKKYPAPSMVKPTAAVSIGGHVTIAGVAASVVSGDAAFVRLLTDEGARSTQIMISITQFKEAGYTFTPAPVETAPK